MIQIVQLALGKSWRPRAIELPFKYNKAIERSGFLGVEDMYFDRGFSPIELHPEALSTKMRLKPARQLLKIAAEESLKHYAEPQVRAHSPPYLDYFRSGSIFQSAFRASRVVGTHSLKPSCLAPQTPGIVQL